MLRAELQTPPSVRIAAIKDSDLNLYHIDGHRHFHFIPAIFKIVLEAAKFSDLEIMIHPGDPEIDKNLENLTESEHLLAKNRYVERL